MNVRHLLASTLALLVVCPVPAPAGVLSEDTTVYISKDKRMGTLRKGAQVEVTEDAGEWLRITYETMDATFEGYVKKATVSMEAAGDIPTGPADPAPAGPTPVEEVRPESPVRPASPVAPVAPAPNRELALSTSWQNGSRSLTQSSADFVGLLNDFGEARVTLRPERAYVLYRKLEYLSPVADAIKTLGTGRVTTEVLKSPGLPSDSFTGSSLDGYFDGFTRIMLVGDRKGQLVAVQLSDRADRDVWLRNIWHDERQNYKKRVEYSDRWRMVNLFEGRMKGNSAWQLGYAFAVTDHVLRVDSELVAGSEWQGRSRERHRTYLPPPIVDLLLQVLAQRAN